MRLTQSVSVALLIRSGMPARLLRLLSRAQKNRHVAERQSCCTQISLEREVGFDRSPGWLVQRLLNYVVPEAVHIMEAGKIIYSGGIEVADILEQDGYEGIKSRMREEASKQPVSA